MRIWLPENWESGDLNEVQAHLLKSLPSLASEFPELVKNYEQTPQSMVLFAFDSATASSSSLTNMNVSTYPAPGVLQMENILQMNLDQLASPLVQVVEQEIVTVDGNQTGRAVVETRFSGEPIRVLMYLLKPSDTIWAASYATPADEYAERAPVFEQSIQSIEISPGD